MILDRIVEDKRLYIEDAKKVCPVSELTVMAGMLSGAAAERRSMIGSIHKAAQQQRPPVIAEIKRRSPSGGDMQCDFELLELAGIYEESGAVGISVLTDEKYFGGNPKDLLEVKQNTKLSVLRKDFIIDEYQIFEAAAYGADVILLIAAILEDAQIAQFLRLARDLGLEVLLEAHTEEELRRSISVGARLLGINNRNLDTLVTDLNTSVELLKLVPDDRIAISESGIRTGLDMRLLLEAGADGFLIGESLLKSGDPRQKLAELLQTQG